MKRLTYFLGLSLLITILAACATGPGAPEPAQPTDTSAAPTPVETEAPLPEAANAARQALAGLLNVDVNDITVSKITEQEFTDSCLGLGGAHEGCLTVMTPGFVVEMSNGGMTFTYHASQDGSAVRMAAPEAVRAAIQALAGFLSVDAREIAINSITAQEFTDSCLGLGGANEGCMAVMAPGFVVEMSTGGMTFTYHASQDGSAVRLAAPEALRAATQALAAKLGIAADEITLNEITPREFRDGCLELATAGEMCTDVMVPGYVIDLSAGDSSYVYHTNKDGTVVRINETNPSTGLPVVGNDAVVQGAIEFLAGKLGIANETIRFVSKEAVDWSDACLGIQEPGVGCATVITPGFKIILESGGTQYIIHTDKEGTKFALEK